MNIQYLIDGHFDMLSDVAVRRKNGERQVIRRLYWPDFQAGGVTGVIASLFVDSQYLPWGAADIAMEQISALIQEVEESSDILMLCTCADDFIRAAAGHKLGILMSFEGAEPVTSCLTLHGFYHLGVRGLGLAWSRRNAAADGCDFSGGLKKGGLTAFGRELVKEAESLHMFIDVSHLSDEGVEDVLDITSRPIAATHSNARAIAGNNRNLTDRQMKEIASRGGIAGLNGCSIIAEENGSEATPASLIRHLKHMTSVMGSGHVGFGFDFCDIFLQHTSAQDLGKMPEYPFDIVKGHGAIPEFLKLLRQEFCAEDIRKLAGENWLSFMKRIFEH